ncbi:hypothetical protein HGRIS_004851 [Hohenbuehelia grisea]|uniref:DUF5648 domain-containing protein n=1 Tax=Hohenbuehelia grisea TaxID=104357 RepID=A0ABR3JE31_9AGAR
MRLSLIFLSVALSLSQFAVASPNEAAENAAMAAQPYEESPKGTDGGNAGGPPGNGGGRGGDDNDNDRRRPGPGGSRGDDGNDRDDHSGPRPGHGGHRGGGKKDDDDGHGGRHLGHGGHRHHHHHDVCEQALEHLQTVYELRLGYDRMYATNHTEIIELAMNKKWTIPKAGGSFKVFSKQIKGTIPITRHYNPKTRRHTLAATEAQRNELNAKGFLPDGDLGFMFPTSICNTQPVEQFWLGSMYTPKVYPGGRTYPQYTPVNNFVFKMDPTEILQARRSQYRSQGIIGYGYPLTTQPKPRPVQVITTRPDCREVFKYLTPVYEVMLAGKQNWLYTTSHTRVIELLNARPRATIKAKDGVFKILSKQVEGSVSVCRMVNPTIKDHTLALGDDQKESLLAQGYFNDGVLGYMLPNRFCNSERVARLYSAAAKNHVFKLDQTEAALLIHRNRYKDEGTLAYAFSMRAAQPEPETPKPY